MGVSVAMPSTAPGDGPTAAGSSPGRLLVLDGLRGVAAFGVINDHVASATLRAMIPGRYLAVDFFWVLSGFVLALAYNERLGRGLKPLDFIGIRLIRLYPLYLLGLSIAVIATLYPVLRGWLPWTAPELLLAAAFGVLFLPFPPLFAVSGQHLFPLNGPSYSLFYELVVNLVYGLVARHLTPRRLWIVVACAAVLVVLVVPGHPPGSGWRWPDIDAGLVRVAYCFFAGVLVYHLKSRIAIPAIPAWAAIAAYLAMIAVPESARWTPYYNVAVMIVGMPLLVALAAGSTVKGRTAAIFAMLGKLSYGVYVVHLPLLLVLNTVSAHFGLHPPGYQNVLIVAVGAAVLAWLADRYYDQPLRRWLIARLKLGGSRQPAVRHG